MASRAAQRGALAPPDRPACWASAWAAASARAQASARPPDVHGCPTQPWGSAALQGWQAAGSPASLTPARAFPLSTGGLCCATETWSDGDRVRRPTPGPGNSKPNWGGSGASASPR
eukprot:6620953-Alexandrium_andersonii.AAC.1